MEVTHTFSKYSCTTIKNLLVLYSKSLPMQSVLAIQILEITTLHFCSLIEHQQLFVFRKFYWCFQRIFYSLLFIMFRVEIEQRNNWCRLQKRPRFVCFRARQLHGARKIAIMSVLVPAMVSWAGAEPHASTWDCISVPRCCKRWFPRHSHYTARFLALPLIGVARRIYWMPTTGGGGLAPALLERARRCSRIGMSTLVWESRLKETFGREPALATFLTLSTTVTIAREGCARALFWGREWLCVASCCFCLLQIKDDRQGWWLGVQSAPVSK